MSDYRRINYLKVGEFTEKNLLVVCASVGIFSIRQTKLQKIAIASSQKSTLSLNLIVMCTKLKLWTALTIDFGHTDKKYTNTFTYTIPV